MTERSRNVFEKMVGRLTKGAVANVKRTVKEEIAKSSDDILPTLVGVASIALLLLAAVPPQKAMPSTITINNYYFRR